MDALERLDREYAISNKGSCGAIYIYLILDRILIMNFAVPSERVFHPSLGWDVINYFGRHTIFGSDEGETGGPHTLIKAIRIIGNSLRSESLSAPEGSAATGLIINTLPRELFNLFDFLMKYIFEKICKDPHWSSKCCA